MRKNLKRIKIGDIWGLLNKTAAFSAIIVIVYLLIYLTKRDNRILHECSSYTIAYVTDVNRKRTKTYVDFYTIVNNKKHFDFSHEGSDCKINPGDRYLVKFCIDDIRTFLLFSNKQIPDSIKTAPKEGWNKMPF